MVPRRYNSLHLRIPEPDGWRPMNQSPPSQTFSGKTFNQPIWAYLCMETELKRLNWWQRIMYMFNGFQRISWDEIEMKQDTVKCETRWSEMKQNEMRTIWNEAERISMRPGLTANAMWTSWHCTVDLGPGKMKNISWQKHNLKHDWVIMITWD